MKIKEWKFIPNTFNKYKISNFGEVYSLKTNKLLKPFKNKYGYLLIDINGNKFLVHRLVAQLFINNPNNLPQVNHKDENKLNNFVDNLEWCTQIYNINYGNGIIKRSKLVGQYTLDNKLIKIWKSTREVERILKISHADISKSCRGKKGIIGGFRWKYE